MADPHAELRDYLDLLLGESAPAPRSDPSASRPTKAASPKPVPRPEAPTPKPEPGPQPAIKLPRDPPQQKESADGPMARGQRAAAPEGVAVATSGPQPPPAWAREPFQCLRFRVVGVEFVVPLLALQHILAWDRPAVRLPGAPDWFLGLLPRAGGGRVGLVDMARILMPERVASRDPRRAEGYVLIAGDGRWGIVCDAIAETLTVASTEVRWHRRRGAPPGCIGLLQKELCTLLDLDGLLAGIGHGT